MNQHDPHADFSAKLGFWTFVCSIVAMVIIVTLTVTGII